MSSEATPLDADELMHLAADAIDRDDPERAIAYLKRLLEVSPDDGAALYLLGAVHAGIGMYERAIAEMSRAVELEPGISIAHFQLGLLLAVEGSPEQASEAWKPLAALGPEAPLFLFARGVEHFLQDRPAACIADLARGIELNTDYPSLDRDIENILAGAREALEESRRDDPGAGSGGAAAQRLLDAYRRSEPDASD